MVTARKEAALAMRKTDVVIEVLDARVPYSSRNPLVESLRRENQRPALKLLNKSDVADPERTRRWLGHYNAQPGVKAVALSAKKASDVQRIPKHALALAPHRGSPLKPLRMMILGVPNVGKSTLMNTLLKRVVTKVGDEPAVTKMHLRHELGPGMWLVDTPGMMWPGISPAAGLKLAITHSIGRNAYDNVEVAAALGAYLLGDYPALLAERFGPTPDAPDGQASLGGHALLGAIARHRSLLIKGGAPDLERAARVLLGEFRAGTLGKITLETPEQIAAEQDPAEHEATPAEGQLDETTLDDDS